MNFISSLIGVLTRPKPKRRNEIVVGWSPDQSEDEFLDMLKWCSEHKVITNHIKEEVKAGMTHHFSLKCPDKATLVMAKLRWGGR